MCLGGECEGKADHVHVNVGVFLGVGECDEKS